MFKNACYLLNIYFIASFFEHLYPAGFRKTPDPGVFYFSEMIMKVPKLSPDRDLCSIDSEGI